MDKFSRVLEQTKRFMPLLVCAVIGVAFYVRPWLLGRPPLRRNPRFPPRSFL